MPQTAYDSLQQQQMNVLINQLRAAGQDIEASSNFQVGSWGAIAAGTLITLVGTASESPQMMIVGSLIYIAAVPLRIIGEVRKNRAGKRLKYLKVPVPKKTNNQAAVKTTKNTTPEGQIEPEYALGQTVKFKNEEQIIEGKILAIDSTGLRLEYYSEEALKPENVFVSHDKIVKSKPN